MKAVRTMRKVFTVLLVLFPFLNQFGLPVSVPILTHHVSIGYLVVIPFALFVCLFKIPTEGLFRMKVYGFSGYFLFLLVVGVSAFLAQGKTFYSGNGKLFDVGLMVLFWLLVLYASRNVFDLRFGMKVYTGFAVVCALYFLLQFIVYRIGGFHLPTVFRESYVFGGSYVDAFRATGTPTSLFITTEAFALYCLPVVAYLLLWDRIGFNGREFACALVLSAALCLTEIVPVIVALLLIWGLFILFIVVYLFAHPYDAIYRFQHQNPSRIVLQIVTPLVIVAGASLLLMQNGRYLRLFSGIRKMICDPAVTSGFASAKSVGTHGGVVRLFGCGVGNVRNFLTADKIKLPATMNSLGYVFLAVGIVGLLLYVGSLFVLLATRRGKFGLAMAALSLFAAVFGNIVFLDISVFWIMLAFSANDNEEMTFRKFLRLRK